MKIIPYGRQDITQEDVDSVIKVLKSDFITHGPSINLFEESLRNYTKANFVSVLNSATSALHISCLALGVGKDDIVWTSANTFVASANCALYCGARVDFVDIDPLTNNICVNSLEEKLIKAQKSGNLPKVVIPVHLTGQSCKMNEIYNLSLKYGFSIIEDASHAIGGHYENHLVGSCKYSDITVFSFHPVKIITTGEGGAAHTNSKDLHDKIKLLLSHGITKEPSVVDPELNGLWYYEQFDLGYNYRMTDIQAALGVSQIKRLDKIIKDRNRIAKRYDAELKQLPIKIPTVIDECLSSRHLYVIRLNVEEIDHTHKEIFKDLRKNGIGVNLHYIPVYYHPYYKKMGFKKGYCPESEKYHNEAISIPIYPTLSESDQTRVIDVLTKIVK